MRVCRAERLSEGCLVFRSFSFCEFLVNLVGFPGVFFRGVLGAVKIASLQPYAVEFEALQPVNCVKPSTLT